MAAQHQHYVPKLLLRGFLSRNSNEAAKEQVRVYDLQKGRDYPTSISNIMGERRYNDFWVDEDTLATLEEACGRIESHVAPLVDRIRQEKRLHRTEEELYDLALLMAFQFIRTKKMRLLPERLDKQLRAHVQKLGFDPADVEGIFDWNEDALKNQHARLQVDNLTKYTDIIAKKDFFLMIAPKGCSFYIGDNPVVLHTDEPQSGIMRGLGLGVPYIQIYLPLSADVLLCAYCPAIFAGLMRTRDEEAKKTQGMALQALMDGKITAFQMKELMEFNASVDIITPLINAIRAGKSKTVGPKQVDLYNSLQVSQAHRFVVDPDGRFEIAKKIVADRATAINRGLANEEI